MTRVFTCALFAMGALAAFGVCVRLSAAEHSRVPGFERFYQDDAADSVAGGRLLLGELSCTSCHAADAAAESILRKEAPVLSAVGNRVRPEYLRQFIANPSVTKPGTSMPHLFQGLSDTERAEQVDALVHYLASTGKIVDSPAPTSLAKQGEQLFHSVGCVACHDARREASASWKTSVPLGKLEPKYTVNGLLAFLKDPHHVRPSGRMPSLNLNDDEARKIACFLLQDLKVASMLTYDYYEGDWQKLPDFSKQKPKSSGTAANFDVVVGRREKFGIVFRGFVAIDKAANYKFRLGSDDGSRLLINGREVVNNDGIHPHSHKEGRVQLTPGIHDLTVEYFEQGGEESLSVEIEGGGIKLQPLVGFLRKSKDPQPADEKRFAVDAGKVEVGRTLFASIGCASCHQMQGVNSTAAKPPALASLKTSGGCLSASATKPHVPHFAVNQQQKDALVAALQAFSAGKGSLDADAQIAHALTSFNCYACHERDKIGGVERDRNPFFQSNQKEMGDEGRIPPTLTNVGGKLKSDWLRHVFNNGAKDRPYMFTRMPKFGTANVGQLVSLLELHDREADAKQVATDIDDRKLKAAGRHLAGSKAFSCIKCHTFANFKATGIQALSLTTMTKRLNEDWFHQYMLDPQAYRPGTRMPASWPRGQVLLKKVLDGQADTQIHALWTYLADAEKAAVPSGLENNPIELIAFDEPVMYRNFIDGAGPRAIGVGYPEKVNIAFDAQNLRLALLWHNAFIDAAKHWRGRGPGFQRPLGDNILKLPDAVSFAKLESQDASWPQQKARELGYQFRGYKLDALQRPTFLYEVHGVRIADTPKPVSDETFAPLVREFTIDADGSDRQLYYRAAIGKITAADDGWFEVDDTWKTRIQGIAADRLILRQSSGKTELLVPLSEASQFVHEYSW